jgi:hypothetical protein
MGPVGFGATEFLFIQSVFLDTIVGTVIVVVVVVEAVVD